MLRIMYAIINLTYNNKGKVSEGGTGSRHPLLGDAGRSPCLNFSFYFFLLNKKKCYVKMCQKGQPAGAIHLFTCRKQANELS